MHALPEAADHQRPAEMRLEEIGLLPETFEQPERLENSVVATLPDCSEKPFARRPGSWKTCFANQAMDLEMWATNLMVVLEMTLLAVVIELAVAPMDAVEPVIEAAPQAEVPRLNQALAEPSSPVPPVRLEHLHLNLWPNLKMIEGKRVGKPSLNLAVVRLTHPTRVAAQAVRRPNLLRLRVGLAPGTVRALVSRAEQLVL